MSNMFSDITIFISSDNEHFAFNTEYIMKSPLRIWMNSRKPLCLISQIQKLCNKFFYWLTRKNIQVDNKEYETLTENYEWW